MVLLGKNQIKLLIDLKPDTYILSGNILRTFNTNNNKTLFWFDTETSGLSEKENQVLSIAVVATDIFFNIKGKLYLKIKPIAGMKFEEAAMKVNKLDISSKEFLDEAVEEKDALELISDFVDDYKSEMNQYVAQNSSFDLKFVEAMISRHNHDNFIKKYYTADTLPFFRMLVKKEVIKTIKRTNKNGLPYSSSQLSDIASALGVESKGAHNALEDVLMLIESVKRAAKLYFNEDFYRVYTCRFIKHDNFFSALKNLSSMEISNLLNNNKSIKDFVLECDSLKFENEDNRMASEELMIAFDLETETWEPL